MLVLSRLTDLVPNQRLGKSLSVDSRSTDDRFRLQNPRIPLNLTVPLLGLHSLFDRSMILLQDVVQVLDRPMSAAEMQRSLSTFQRHPLKR